MARTRWTGGKRLRRKLRAMPREVREAIRGALVKNAEELVALQKQYAPVDFGDLKDSIHWRFTRAGEQETRGGVKGELGLSVTVAAGDEDVWYADWVEFGTAQGQVAQPFFFPPYRLNKRRYRSRITREQNKAIKRVASRG